MMTGVGMGGSFVSQSSHSGPRRSLAFGLVNWPTA